MILITSLREQDYFSDAQKLEVSSLKPKDVLNGIIKVILQLSWLDLEISKSIKQLYIFNETALIIKSEDIRKIYIPKIIFQLKKNRPRYNYVHMNQIQYLSEMVKNVIVLNNTEFDLEKISESMISKEIYFISNRAGIMTLKLIQSLQSSFVHPIQYSKVASKYQKIANIDLYYSILDETIPLLSNTKKIRPFYDRDLSVIEFLEWELRTKLNSIETNDKIFLKGGDNYLIEEIIKYIIKGKYFNFLWDFRDGIPEFERNYDTLLFFNIDHLQPTGQSSFWLRVRDFNYIDKLIVVTAKNENFKFVSPYEFKTIEIPRLDSMQKELLKVIVLFANKKNPKSAIWKVPGEYYNNKLLTFLTDIPEISTIDTILDNMELAKYFDKILSPDFWYDFLELKKIVIDSGTLHQQMHSISSYLIPLPEAESKKIERFGILYSLSKQKDRGYIIELPSKTPKKLKKSAGLDYIYYLIENKITFANPIDVEDLYLKVNGEIYLYDNKLNYRTSLLGTIRASVKYLFTEQAKYLIDLMDCVEIGEEGCYFDQKGNIRVKIMQNRDQ